MDRARSSHFVWQLPRGSMELVVEQEQVEDKQLLLNETWPHYCDRFDGCREVERSQVRQKWVTETWEEYENRIPKREANVHRFFRRQAIREDAAAADVARREAAAERTLAEIRSREHRRKIRFLPTLNTLLQDPMKDLEAQFRQEQAEIMKEERRLRRLVEDEQFRKMCQTQYDEDQQRRWLEAELERRRREEEERQRRQAEEEARRRAEEEEARRRQEEEERRQQQEELARQKEEALRKRRELEERRKAEQQRMKEERERQKKAEEEAEALRRRLAEQEQEARAEAASREEPEDLWGPVREDQTQRMAAFLADLQGRVSGAESVAALEEVMDWAVKAMGAFMSSFAFYVGLLDGPLRYKYASETSSTRLRGGGCQLDPAQHGACPTLATVVGKLEEVFVSNVHSNPDMVFLGDGPLLTAEVGEGDFFGLPILCEDGTERRCVAVLGADTLTGNGGSDAWQSAHPNGPRPRPMDEPEKQFLREVAQLFGAAFSALAQEPPPAEAAVPDAALDPAAELRALQGTESSVGKVLGAGLAAICKYLNDSGMNGYIARPNHGFSTLSVVYQFAGGKVYGVKDASPSEGVLGRHTYMVGKQLSGTSTLSFQLFGEGAPAHLYCPDESQAEDVALYGGGTAKPADCLLVAAITPAGAPKPFAVLGVEAPADPGLSEKQVSDLLRAAAMLGELIRPLRLQMQTSGICKQVIQWLEATTGVRNVYVSVPDGPGLRYIAANRGNEHLVGQTLDSLEGVSHDVWEADSGEVFVKDLKAEAENGGRVKFWVEEHKGQPGQCLFLGIKSEDGTPLAVLGCDTLGGTKLTISEEDCRVIRKSAALLSSIFDEIGNGTLDDLTDDLNLQIEELVGAGGVRFYKKVLLDVLIQLSGLTKDQLLEVARYNSPPELVVKVVSATLVVLQHKPRLVKEWDACRKHVKQPLIDKMKSFDATREGKKRKNFFRRAKSMLKGLDMQTVFEKGSLPASLFFQWSYVSVQLRYLADRLRRQAREGTLDLGDDEEDRREEEEGPEEGEGEGEEESDAGAEASEAEAEGEAPEP